jgi:MFS family permease
LQESFKNSPGSALVAVKGFISCANMLYPLLVGALVGTMYTNAALWLPAILALIVAVLTLFVPFSYDEALKKPGRKALIKAEKVSGTFYRIKPSLFIEGVCLLIYGGIAFTTFYLIQQSVTIYGKDVLGLSELSSRGLMVYYTVGSLLAVAISAAAMAKGVRTIAVLFVYTIGAVLSLFFLSFVHIYVVVATATFFIGFFAAGGALQAGIALLGEYFPGNKGRNLGLYYTFMGLASFTSPKVAAKIIKVDGVSDQVGRILYFDFGIAIVGFVIIGVLSLRYRKIFGASPFALRVKTGG